MFSPLTPPSFQNWPQDDGYVVRGRVWNANAPSTRTPILYLHGIQSHGGWYEWSASVLASQGQTVMMPDRRGSGLNHDARGDTRDRARWLADVDAHVAWLRKTTSAERVAIVGVSWGGKLAASWASQNQDKVETLLLIAPGIFPAVDLKWSEKCGVGVALIRSPEQYFPIPLNDPTLFTSNEAGQQFIATDPLLLTHVTARFLIQSRKLDRDLHKLPDRSLQVPICLLLSEKDRIIENGRTREWATRVCAVSPVLVDFPNERHTLEFSANRAAFEKALLGWSENSTRPSRISG